MKQPTQPKNPGDYVPCAVCGPSRMGWAGERCAICGTLRARDAAIVLINQQAMHDYANMTKGTVN